MRKLRKRTVMAGMAAVLMLGSGIAKAEVSVTADFASAYVFRGVTFNDGAVFQPGVEVSGFPIPEEFGSFTVGAWGNYDIEDYDGNLNGSELSEIDLFASYALPIKFVDLSVGYTDYTYPNGGPADKEVSASIGKEFAGFEAGAAAYFGTGGSIKKSEYYEFSLGYGLDITDALGLSIGGTVAYLDPDGAGSGWHNATATAGISYALTEKWGISASITYVGQLNDKILTDAYNETADLDGDGSPDGWQFGYDTEFYGTAGVSCTF